MYHKTVAVWEKCHGEHGCYIFGKVADAGNLFERLVIAGNEYYKAHLNRHNVVYIDFSEVPRDYTSYRQYIARIQDGINSDLARM